MKHIVTSILLLCIAAVNSFAQKPPPPRNTGGSSGTNVGPSLTSPSSIENIPVYRLQLRLITADVTDAGTDDEVYVTFNTVMKPYYLNLAIDDRERKSDEKYDLVSNDIQFIRDIKDFTITKSGTDGWGIKSVILMVNGKVIFQKDFSSPQWVDGDDGRSPNLVFSSATLRGSAIWNLGSDRTTIFMPPRSLTKADLKTIIESYIGNALKMNNSINFYHWGDFDGVNTQYGDDVELKFQNTQTLNIDLDLELRDLLGDMEIDADFDMVLSCQGNKPVVLAQNIKGRNTDFISGGQDLTNSFKDAIPPLTKYLTRSFTLPGCSPHFDAGGNLIYW